MLAKSGKAFDSDAHVFELKWDGMRTLAFAEGGTVRLVNRQKNVVTERYPELHGLAELPNGTVLDGEIAFLNEEGKPVFENLLHREQVRGARNIAAAQLQYPAVYAAFDLLYDGFSSTMDLPLAERRERLQQIVAELGDPRILFSDGVMGAGVAFFEQACARELEGIVAKRLDSRYLAGRRTDAWVKIKRAITVYCAILGWLPDGEDIKSLHVGTDVDGELRWVGRVGSGLGDAERRRLGPLLRERECDSPIVPVADEGRWVAPGLYCTVTYLERTGGGMLRAPRFGDLVVEE